jgi:NAD(P)-dependent dehydrogenase (short-subunit alcohol dehydrogenase family)
LRNRQALITGGTGGLGLAVTYKILTDGARVTLSYRTENEIDHLRADLSGEYFEKIRFVQADLTREENVEHLVAQLPDLQILIHLVGGFAMGAITDFPRQNWDEQILLNLTTTFLTCKYSLRPMFRQNYGRIVTVGSRAAEVPLAGTAAYSAAKAGVVALTRAIADETRGTNITANVILPSVIDTPANRRNMGEQNADKWVKPEIIAELISFLASEAAQDIRGAVVPIYGSV